MANIRCPNCESKEVKETNRPRWYFCWNCFLTFYFETEAYRWSLEYDKFLANPPDEKGAQP